MKFALCLPSSVLAAALSTAALATGAPHHAHARDQGSARADASLCAAFKARPDVQLSLFFGLYRPAGAPITEQEWNDFVKTEITPRFPLGLSVLSIDGQWQDRVTGHVGHEPSRLVWISTTLTPDLSGRIETIRAAYRTRFQQQSVGLVVTPGCDSF
jgi:Protein of unknown function (DUF3574)